MFDLINGIPLHPLVVHAIVVLLPLATLGTLLIAVRPRWRRSYGPLVVVAAAVATVLSPVATSSGEELENRVGDPGQHAQLGDTLVWFALALTLASATLVYLQRRHERATDRPSSTGSQGTSTTALTAVAAIAVVIGLAAGVQTYRVGDSGARAAWGDAATSSAGD